MSWLMRFVSGLILFSFLKRLTFSYLDPGTGSFVLQLVVAGLLSGVLGIKVFWSRIVGVFRPAAVEQDADENEQPS